MIYGVTGGVAEAVVRYCLPDKSKNALRAVSVTNLRGTDGIREVVLPLEGQELRIAIVNGDLPTRASCSAASTRARCPITSSRSCPARVAASAARVSPTA